MIIAGFPGIGKTEYQKNSKLPVCDSDSSNFENLEDGSPNPNFIEEYFAHIESVLQIQQVIVLVSTHEAVLRELKRRNMNYVVVIPEEGLLDEYIERYQNRGSTETFINLIASNWFDWLEDIKSNHKCFELTRGEYLTSFIVETYETGKA